jgi:hypothetical protein
MHFLDLDTYLLTGLLKHTMTDLVKVGPPDNYRLPNKSLGIIFFNEMKKWDPSRIAIVRIFTNFLNNFNVLIQD